MGLSKEGRKRTKLARERTERESGLGACESMLNAQQLATRSSSTETRNMIKLRSLVGLPRLSLSLSLVVPVRYLDQKAGIQRLTTGLQGRWPSPERPGSRIAYHGPPSPRGLGERKSGSKASFLRDCYLLCRGQTGGNKHVRVPIACS